MLETIIVYKLPQKSRKEIAAMFELSINPTILDKLRALPPVQQQEVLDFAEFLQQKNLLNPA